MRIVLLSVFSFFLFSLKGQGSKQDLFCHRWLEIGYKLHGEKLIHQENPDVNLTLQFFQNNTFTEDSYIENATGNWIFNSDTTKFGIEYTLYNNQKIRNLVPIATASLIIKLTEDTLIYGIEHVKGVAKANETNDYYFVRQN